MVGSLSVLCGQLIVVGLEGAELTVAERSALTSGERGGVVLFRRNVPKVACPPGGPIAFQLRPL